MELVKVYNNWLSRAITEKTLFKQGYKVLREEEVKEFDGNNACCLGCMFLPLAFLAQKKKIKVTYIK